MPRSMADPPPSCDPRDVLAELGQGDLARRSGDHLAVERAGYRTLVDTAAREPGVARDRIAVVGVSEGAIVALTETDPRVRAIVADSGYRRAAGTTGSPVLLLGFINDPNVAHVRLVAFAAGERAAGAPVETHFYAGTGHVALLTPATRTDATARAFAFLGRALR